MMLSEYKILPPHGEEMGFAFSAIPTAEELAGFELNDFGNAMRLIRQVGGEIKSSADIRLELATLLYVREVGWIGWNGSHWDQKLGPRLAERMAHRVAEMLPGQVPAMGARGVDKKQAWAFAKDSGNAGRAKATLSMAETYLQVDLDQFDADPLALNVRNGTLRFRTGADGAFFAELSPHDPRDRMTRMANVDYDVWAAAPTWEAALRTWQPDPEMQRYLRRISGYAATGQTSEQVFIIHQGKGGDGKSTFVNQLRAMSGTYADVADVRTFLDIGARGGGDATPDLARLAGDCRFLSVAEPPRGAKLNESMIKSFTGGAPIVARRLRQDLFAFTPKPKVMMECNSRPRITGDDAGIWRRIRLVMWEHQISKGNMDQALPVKLQAEASGILNWVIAGVGDWLSNGLAEPARVEAAMDDYRKGSSPFGEWFADCLELDDQASVPASHLFTSYKDWCLEQGIEKPMSQTAFGNSLADRQIIRSGRGQGGVIMRQGARLKGMGERLNTSEILGAGGFDVGEQF